MILSATLELVEKYFIQMLRYKLFLQLNICWSVYSYKIDCPIGRRRVRRRLLLACATTGPARIACAVSSCEADGTETLELVSSKVLLLEVMLPLELYVKALWTTAVAGFLEELPREVLEGVVEISESTVGALAFTGEGLSTVQNFYQF